MTSLADKRLSRLVNSGQAALLKDNKTGLEKECLRVTPDGNIAFTPHPLALGSALTHPHITTDYSEALLEFITPPFTHSPETLDFLCAIHQFVYGKLGDELLWAASMPCVVAGEDTIPIAQYGNSHVGMMKTIYRRGLSYRYGRMMQVIAGVHFNFSLAEAFWPLYQEQETSNQDLQDFVSESYFAMIRNLQRIGWLILYLFGSSPAICKSFLHGKATDMPEFDANSYYSPYGTSLRMGDIGYTNSRESIVGVKACYDTMAHYISCLTRAIETPYPEYEKIGIVVDGEYRQLNANVLQIENEYYSTVRPKQVARSGEKPTLALERRGVKYVELRSCDVNIFEPVGVSGTQLYFLEALMVFCLLAESPAVESRESDEIDRNLNLVAYQGRDPALVLLQNEDRRKLGDWALEIIAGMEGICDLLDDGEAERPYRAAWEAQKEVVLDADRTPSARIITEMSRSGEGFYHFARRKSQEHRQYFSDLQTDPARAALFEEAAAESLEEQEKRGKRDRNTTFEEYLQRYFSQK